MLSTFFLTVGSSNIFQDIIPNVIQLGWGGDQGWGTSILQTLLMTFVSAFIGGFLGLIFGVGLVITAEGGIREQKKVYWILDKIVSVFRALPFIILLAFISPLTRALVGTQIGTVAALVPLSLGVFPFYARQIQVALQTVSKGKIEAAISLGANFDDLLGVYLKESLSEIIRVSTVTLISLVGLTAMAGVIGGGGLGNTVLQLGYGRFQDDITIFGTILILIFILIIQFVGDFLAKKTTHK